MLRDHMVVTHRLDERTHALLQFFVNKMEHLLRKVDTVMLNQTQLGEKLDLIGDTLDKAKIEIEESVEGLKNDLRNAGNLSPAIEAKVDRISRVAEAFDALNVDKETPPGEVPPVEEPPVGGEVTGEGTGTATGTGEETPPV